MAKQIKINPFDQPNAFSYGSNTSTPKVIFNERQKYDSYVFPDSITNNFFNSWKEDRFYGLVNTRGNATLPKVQALAPLYGAADRDWET